MIVTLVATWVAYGMDYERHQVMPDLTACQTRAVEVMTQMLNSKDYDAFTQIGVGCVVDRDGEPA